MPTLSHNQPLLVSQKLAVNKDLQQNNKILALEFEINRKNQSISADAQLLRRGDKVAETQADELFAQANSYAQISPKVKQSLHAYESLEISNKRETISSLMGIDLYA